MTIKVYVSGICGSQEVRKRQQRVLFILQTMPIDLEVIDVTEPGREDDRIFMQEEVKKHDKKILLPPQIFNDNKYCGDYADFQLANDDDEVMSFLKLEESTKKITENGVKDSSKNDNAHENTGEVIDTTGENLNVPENQNIMVNNVNAEDSDVEMQNIASHQEDPSNVVEEDKKIISSTEEKAMFSEESAEEDSE